MKINFEDDVLALVSKEQIEALKEKFLTKKLIKILSDEQTIVFCNALFENNLNVSVTAQKVFMHRNTLSYKINKILKTTGLDLRNFEDAFTFKILIAIYSKTV